jgi:glutathione synthase/RimK-type ligase-like ATP-grasp enzyme
MEVTTNRMKLLVIADNDEEDQLADRFSNHFDEVKTKSIANVRIDAGDGEDIRISGEKADNYDALYLQPKPQTAIFSRVFLEVLLEKDITTNIDAASFFILAKKNYLFQVLEEKSIPTPATAIVSTEKGISGIEEHIDYPLVGKKFEGFERRDMNLLESGEELRSFVEHMDHGNHVLILQEFIEGDVYDCLYVDGDIVSLSLSDDSWRVRSGEAKGSYLTISSELKEVVEQTAHSIGADICRIRLVNGKVTEAYLDPDLERFTEVSGKNMYEKVATYLKA